MTTVVNSVSSTSCGSTMAPAGAPGVPQNLSAIGGDQLISVSWSPPASNAGGPVQSYVVCALASSNTGSNVTNSNIIISTNDTQLVVQTVLGMMIVQNGLTYSVTVAASNANGIGPATAPLMVTPGPVTLASYTPLSIQGDDSPSGVSDPSVLRSNSGEIWMAYSSVNDRDVGIRLARSNDGGRSFKLSSTIAAPDSAVVTDTDPRLSACGSFVCSGRWAYEKPWLVEDQSDPNAARRFKLFAYKYFLSPSRSAPTRGHLGAIVMWTAASPQGPWSEPTSILGSSLTPPELTPTNLINALHADLATCLASPDGGAAVIGDTLDLVLTCMYPGSDPLPQKIVLLRSADHAATFQYISTLLTPDDAAALGAKSFTAPSLWSPPPGMAPVLIATPTTLAGDLAGCAVFQIANKDTGALLRQDGVPIKLLSVPALENHQGGACAWDRGLGRTGILINDVTPGATQAEATFRILATGRGL